MTISQTRRDALKSMLEARRDEIQAQIDSQRVAERQLEDRRPEERRSGDFNDEEASIQDDINFALMQMKAGTLDKLIGALQRLEQDAYGNCYDCHGEISERRLSALPFAVRCKDCEESERRRKERERRPPPIFSLN